MDISWIACTMLLRKPTNEAVSPSRSSEDCLGISKFRSHYYSLLFTFYSILISTSNILIKLTHQPSSTKFSMSRWLVREGKCNLKHVTEKTEMSELYIEIQTLPKKTIIFASSK